jgi:hypothetical protein
MQLSVSLYELQRSASRWQSAAINQRQINQRQINQGQISGKHQSGSC